MTSRKQTIILFISIIAMLSLFFQWIYSILTEKKQIDISDLFVDLPFIMLMSFISLLLVHTTNKHFKYKDNIYIRVAFELFIASVFAIVYSVILQCILRPILISDLNIYLKPTIILLLGNIIVILIFELFFYNQRQMEARRHIAIIEKERAEYLYATLKNQINPHFLFNSLNVLSSLTFEDAHRANVYTKKLSNIYRYVLSTNTQEKVEVKEEIFFLESYIYLLSIRFENALDIVISGDKVKQAYIIPVSLQLLLENAIKHNIASVSQPLRIDISISQEYIEVTNNLQLRLTVEESGYGLDNLQKQYKLFNKVIDICRNDTYFTVKIPYL